MDKNEINYFIYARKSTEGEERQSLSIEGQLKDNQKTIQQNGLKVLDTIVDTASAAIPYNRPGYTDMIRRLKKGEASGIIVWHVDRLIRNELEDGEFRWLLQTGVIKSIWTPTREYRSADNALLISIEASMAAQYSRDLSVKVKRANKLLYEKGHTCSVAPIGYLNTKFSNPGTNYIIEDPERFHIMRKGFDLLLSGMYKVSEVIAKLNNEYGLRSRKTNKAGGKPISRSTMYRILTDPFYSGYFYRSGILYKGSYKPMITVEEFDKIQVMLGKPLKAKPHKHEFSFTGLMKCGACGGAITASRKIKLIKKTGTYKTYVFYHCTKRKSAAVCTEMYYTTEKEMETLIENELSKITLTKTWEAWAIETINENYRGEVQKHEVLLKNTLAYEKKILSSLDTMLDLRINGEITEEQYIQKKSEKQYDLVRVQEKRNRLESNIEDWNKQLIEKLDFAKSAIEQFRTGDPKLQKSICQCLGWNWILQGKKLTYSMHNWFVDIEDLLNYFEQNKEALEPIKTFKEFKESPYYKPACLMLLRALDHIRTAFYAPSRK